MVFFWRWCNNPHRSEICVPIVNDIASSALPPRARRPGIIINIKINLADGHKIESALSWRRNKSRAAEI